jgi:hypothetical protein
MISEICERFRYRFQLWWREQRQDYFGSSSAAPFAEDYVSYYTDRDRILMLKESTVRLVGRTIQAYFGPIIVVSWILLFIARRVPSARFGIGVGFLSFVGLWTFAMITENRRLRKARKQYREQQAVNHLTKRCSEPRIVLVCRFERMRTSALIRTVADLVSR